MLKWGILGTSFISETMAQAIVNDSGSSIQAVAGRRQAAVNSFAQKFPTSTQYTNYDQLINDPEVDIVYVGLPNHLHHQYILAAILAEKHVLSEKSLSTDMEKSQQILEAVSNYSKLVIEGLMYLHHPLIAKLIELLQANAIGNIRTVSGQYCADIANLVNPEGKGAIYNLGCYPVSLLHLVMQSVFGDDIWADADLAAIGSKSKGDGNICDASLIIKLSNGVSARIHTAETFGMFSHFDIVGNTGSLHFDTNPWLPTESNFLTLTSHTGNSQQIPVVSAGDAFYYQVKEVRKTILQGKSELERPAPRIQDSFEIMEILTQWESLCLNQLAE